MKFSVLAAIAAPILVSAQSGAPPDSAASSPASTAPAVPAPPPSSPQDHVVQVGAGSSLLFQPNGLTVNEGETITFFFAQPPGFMHSVTQSNFSNPCSPLPGGFNSGLQNPGAKFTLKITNATQPIWLYCENDKPLKHCGMGMVAAINVGPSNRTIAEFIVTAKAIGNNEPEQTASPALSGIGAVAIAPADPTSASASSPAPTPTGGAEKLAVGAGSLMATLLALFALA